MTGGRPAVCQRARTRSENLSIHAGQRKNLSHAQRAPPNRTIHQAAHFRSALTPITPTVICRHTPTHARHIHSGMPATRYPQLATLLRRYFYSGWAFLIPYLAAYLLYYVTAWPVNPSPATAEAAASSALTPLTPDASYHLIPSLLHLYWTLHVAHLVLAAIALRSWWTENSVQYAREARNTNSAPYSSYGLHLLIRIAPWAILTLLFYIPGVYLEWPSDPWEHLRRINEWRILDTVSAHSSWHKSSYFIPYSFLSWCIGLRQLFWLDFYYTGICLLLCWQYYRFSRACGLGERASTVFVIIQALLFGNNIFSFYRYYGISSSIYAQLGAIALTRIVLEWAAWGRTNLNFTAPKDTDSSSIQSARPSVPFTRHPCLFPLQNRPTFWHWPTTVGCLSPIALCLLSIIAFNHPQGLGIAGLGIAALVVWRLIEWKRSVLWWLIGGTIAVNALFLWLYPRTAIIETYRSQGWLSAWHGFNIIDLRSVAADRMLQITSCLGLVNLAAVAGLLIRNHVVAWLTFTPILICQLPVFAVPFAKTVSRVAEHYVVTFHRMLFATPILLASIVSLTVLCSQMKWKNKTSSNYSCPTKPVFRIIYGAILLCCCISAGKPGYNRFWHSLASIASDLQLRGSIADTAAQRSQPSSTRTVLTRVGTAATAAAFPNTRTAESRMFTIPATAILKRSLELLGLDESLLKSLHRTSLRQTNRAHTLRLIGVNPHRLSDGNTIAPDKWISLKSDPQSFNYNTHGSGYDSFLIENAKGRCAWVFSSAFYSITDADTLSVAMTVRQSAGRAATVFLAVAWYDESGAFLDSGAPYPTGAGNPPGWQNGIFSYFGLSGDAAPSRWAEYTTTFGLGHAQRIPSHARSIRIGAILNGNEAPDAVIQVRNVQLHRIDAPTVLSVPSKPLAHYSPRSLAGLLSGHWPLSQVAADYAGSKEFIELRSIFETSQRSTH